MAINVELKELIRPDIMAALSSRYPFLDCRVVSDKNGAFMLRCDTLDDACKRLRIFEPIGTSVEMAAGGHIPACERMCLRLLSLES